MKLETKCLPALTLVRPGIAFSPKISRAYNTGRSDRALNGSSISEISVLGDAVIQIRGSHKNSNFVEGNWPGSQDYSIPISRQYLIQIPAKKFEFRWDPGFWITASPRLITASPRTGNFGNHATIQRPVRTPLLFCGPAVGVGVPYGRMSRGDRKGEKQKILGGKLSCLHHHHRCHQSVFRAYLAGCSVCVSAL